MEITRIEKTKRGRMALFSGEMFLFSLHPESFARCELCVGCRVTPQRLEELRCEDEVFSAKQKALAILGHAPNTRYQLLQKLGRHFSEQACEQAVQRMEELGLVNDADYARRCAHDLIELRGWSLRRVAQELTQRGIDREVITECIEILENYDSQEQLLRLLTGKYAKALQDEKSLHKAIQALQRLGYAYGDIRRALRALAEEE